MFVTTTEIPRLKSFERAAAEGAPIYAVQHDPPAKRAWDTYEAAGKAITDGRE